METVQSWLLTSWDPCCQHNHYEPFLLMVFSGELFTRTIHKFKTEYLLIWQKVLEYLDKYQVLWPSSTSKYQVLLNFKRSSTSKYQVLNNLHQVPSTSTLLDPNPGQHFQNRQIWVVFLFVCFLLAGWKLLHPNVITFNTLCLVEFYIQRYGALQWTPWRSYLKQSICSCLSSYFSGKATKVGSPPNFPKLISQLWGTLQSQYFVTLFLDSHWTHLWNYFIYYKKETKVGSQHFGYQIWFCTRLLTFGHALLNPSSDSPTLR